MDQSLQNILSLVEESDALTTEQKQSIAKWAKELDKTISIAEFKLDRTERVKRTTAILLEETIAELEQKRKAVETQKRELEIESALERVRAQAMGMTKPEDLMLVCERMFLELNELGFTALRNTMININNDEKAFFLNHDFSYDRGASITPISYDSHPIIRDFLQQIRRARDAFAEIIVSGSQLDDWKEFRRRIGEQDDPRLEDSPALYYYFYSIGAGALGLSTLAPIDEQHREILRRFRNVFDLAYQRYTDITLAQAQAREAQVALALERVRARTMAMHRSDELAETAAVLFEQLEQLGESPERIAIGVVNEADRVIEIWATHHGGTLMQLALRFTIDEPHVMQKIYHAWKEQQKSIVIDLQGRALEEYFQFLQSNGTPVSREAFGVRRVEHFACFSGGLLAIITPEPRPPEAIQLYERFASVFDLTYTRFLDLQKAEAQAREAKIEAALERVRSRSMGMQRSGELKEVIQVVYDQLVHLNIPIDHTGFVMDYKARDEYHIWIADNVASPAELTIPYFDCVYYNQFNEAKEKGLDFFATNLSFEQKNKFYQDLFTHVPGLPEEALQFLLSCPGLAASTVLLENVCLYIENFSGIPYSDEENATLMRFGKVFQQTYTRFLDLQKAEAQAREAQIEAALERVRSRTMAMHTSDELSEASFVLFKQLKDLGEVAEQMSIGVYDEQEQVLELYATIYGNQWMESGRIPYDKHPVHKETHAAWREKRKSIVFDLSGEELDSFNKFKMETSTQYKSEEVPRGRWVMHTAFFSKGMLTFSTHEPRPPETLHLLERFAAVFDLTYTRFLDLKNAEAQAREAQIEAALERVRSKAMAMHNSGDLSVTVTAVFTELRRLGVHTIRAGVALYSQGRSAPTFYATTAAGNDTELAITGSPDPSINPCLAMQYEAWQKKENYSPVLKGEELKAYYSALSLQPSSHSKGGKPFDHEEYGYYLPFSEGNFYAWSEKPYTTEELSILNRFKVIIDLTFRRYLDLQKAETQARESQIEASLERVRSRTLAMQRSDELAETAAVLFKQLITLGIAPNRLYIAIIKDDSGGVEFWITDEDGSRVSSAYTANLNDNPSFRKMLAGWKTAAKSVTIDMKGEELQEYFRYLTSLNVPFKGGLSQTRRVQTIAYFSKGFLGIASPEEQPVETVTLLERFAAVFNLTFTRFNDLKLAEAQAQQAQLDLILLQEAKRKAEGALSELRSTQEQLLQQEKLASLGQLTAGIAHEIKNPLNFVNNFSAVSVDLLDEAVKEIGDRAPELREGGVVQLLSDVKMNLTKIIEHGTRADGIVRSMLQHSRGGSGRKEPTDLNGLIKGCANLAFHGMRAGDSPINVGIDLELDAAIGSVPIVAEDFSRVILNLCQNAFDAMREKLNAATKPGSYGPRLALQTRFEGDRISIEVADNGPGIPEAIREKILQPFFTTKKGTQGTGLGLSIANDIVKAHGGEMTIESNEYGGASFIIRLPVEPVESASDANSKITAASRKDSR
jgi:signal transduction histidine kinase